MNYKNKKISILVSVIAIYLAVAVPSAFASQIVITPSKSSVGIGEQFYVDVSIDPEGEQMNGIEGSIAFNSENLSFIQAEYGTSVVNTWVEPPALRDGVISFMGIIPNGFSGLIDPFDSKNLLPGRVVRLIFEGYSPGKALITTSPISITKNDGLGTVIDIPSVNSPINVTTKKNPSVYKTFDDQRPALTASIVSDSDLFDGKYVLIFKATDKETGIKSVMIQEGSGEWKEIESPYLLKNQSRSSIINVRAIDLSGNITTVTIEPVPQNRYLYIIIAISFLVLVSVLFFILRRKYVLKKQIHSI